MQRETKVRIWYNQWSKRKERKRHMRKFSWKKYGIFNVFITTLPSEAHYVAFPQGNSKSRLIKFSPFVYSYICLNCLSICKEMWAFVFDVFSILCITIIFSTQCTNESFICLCQLTQSGNYCEIKVLFNNGRKIYKNKFLSLLKPVGGCINFKSQTFWEWIAINFWYFSLVG